MGIKVQISSSLPPIVLGLKRWEKIPEKYFYDGNVNRDQKILQKSRYDHDDDDEDGANSLGEWCRFRKIFQGWEFCLNVNDGSFMGS